MNDIQHTHLGAALWAVAERVRGVMTPDAFRDYFLALTFWYYLSSAYEEAAKQELGNSYDQYNAYLAPGTSAGRGKGDSGSSEMIVLEEDCEGTGVPSRGEGLETTILTPLSAWYAQNPDGVATFETAMRATLQYVIKPHHLWSTLYELARMQSETLLQTLQAGFDVFEDKSSANALHGLFSEVYLDSFKLGHNHEARNATLCSMISEMAAVLSEADHDLLGDAYEYLIAQFADASGRQSGEFYTPQPISTIMSRIVILDGNDPSKGKRQSINGLLDFACGSASLLINVRKQFSPHRIGKIYGQELNRTTYNLARMNMLIHGIRDSEFQIHNGDSLLNDWEILNEENPGERIECDAIVANPPFSCRWDPSETLADDFRFKAYGLAPKSTADYAFLLHGFRFLSDEGTMALVFPHGILFRGGIEETIRGKLLRDGSIDAIIGLPAKLFSSTGVAVCIIVLKKRKSHDDVLFIDASGYFEKGRRQNILLPEHIDKIVDTYQLRKEVEKYSRRVSMEEIRKNDFNLSIQRYVDTTDEEDIVDLSAVNRTLVEIEDTIQRAKARHNQFLRELGLPELP